MTALRIAILGAESTGKTVLAQDLAHALAGLTGLRCTWVPEHLRAWCQQAGRTPRADEQRAIADTQQRLIDAAAAQHDIVVSDTTPLMTAVYSHQVFGDDRLDAWAAGLHAGQHLSLLTALDLAWQPDGLQRDGPQVRQPVDDRIRHLLLANGLGWSLVRGQGPARLACALDAVTPVLRRHFAAGPTAATAAATAAAQAGADAPASPAAGPSGLFTGLAAREAAAEAQAAAWRWVCNDCDQPDCEHALRRQG